MYLLCLILKNKPRHAFGSRNKINNILLLIEYQIEDLSENNVHSSLSHKTSFCIAHVYEPELSRYSQYSRPKKLVICPQTVYAQQTYMNLNYQVPFSLGHIYEPDSSSAKPISKVLDIYLVWNAVSANWQLSTDHVMHSIEMNKMSRP